MKEQKGPFSLILERPFTPFPIHHLHMIGDYAILYNRGKVPLATWSMSLLASKFQPASECNGKSGFVVFSPKFLKSQGWKLLNVNCGDLDSQRDNYADSLVKPLSPLVGIFSEGDSDDAEWAYGSFPLEEYIKALDRAKGELYYNHSLGMQYNKVVLLAVAAHGLHLFLKTFIF